ncbi:MAG: hypothetical protein SFY32_08825 [Bacteroidota bacterium]|nr:hypothetical protein [Bacteroidota bacterium]
MLLKKHSIYRLLYALFFILLLKNTALYAQAPCALCDPMDSLCLANCLPGEDVPIEDHLYLLIFLGVLLMFMMKLNWKKIYLILLITMRRQFTWY